MKPVSSWSHDPVTLRLVSGKCDSNFRVKLCSVVEAQLMLDKAANFLCQTFRTKLLVTSSRDSFIRRSRTKSDSWYLWLPAKAVAFKGQGMLEERCWVTSGLHWVEWIEVRSSCVPEVGVGESKRFSCTAALCPINLRLELRKNVPERKGQECSGARLSRASKVSWSNS